MNISAAQRSPPLSRDFKVFITRFFTEAIAGMLIDEFTNSEQHDIDKAVEYLSLVLNNSLPGVLQNAPKTLR